MRQPDRSESVNDPDPDGDEVDLVPGAALGESVGTADWPAVLSAMACYRITSPTQQLDLAAAAAAQSARSGSPHSDTPRTGEPGSATSTIRGG